MPRSDYDDTIARCQRAFGDAQALYLPVHDAEKVVVGSMGLLSQRVFDSSDGRASSGTRRRRGRRDRGPSRAAHRGDHRGVRGRHPARPLPRGRGHLHRHGHRGPQGGRRQGDRSSRWSRSRPPPASASRRCSRSSSRASRRRPAAPRRPHTRPVGGTLAGRRPATPTDRSVAEVMRTTTDPYVGRLSLVRVFSGTLRADEPVHVSGHLGEFVERRARAGRGAHRPRRRRARRPARLAARRRTRHADRGIAGDIVLVSQAVARPRRRTPSPAKDRPALVEPWVLPEPLLPVAIHAVQQARRGQARAARCSGSSPRT